MSETQTDSPDEHLSYEQARTQLAEVVQQLESGGASLADSMKLWERGEQLAKICQEFLAGAQEKVVAATKNSE